MVMNIERNQYRLIFFILLVIICGVNVYSHGVSYPYGSCWKHVQYIELVQLLSGRVQFTNNGVDSLIANGLIYKTDAIKIREVLSTNMWTKKHNDWLMMEVLPKTGNLGYVKFLCLLPSKLENIEMAQLLCEQCEECVVQKCRQSNKLKLLVGSSSCLPLVKHPVLQQLAEKEQLKSVSIDYEFVHNQKEIFRSSLVCIDNKIFARLSLNIDVMDIEQELFQWKVAAMLGSDKSEVELSVSGSALSTVILLRLSTLAGLELLKVFASQKLKHDFGRGIAGVMSFKSESAVDIMVEVSNLELEHMKVVPTGTLLVESAQSLKKDSAKLLRSFSDSLELHTDDNPVTEVYIYEITKTVMSDYKLWIAAFTTAFVLVFFVLCLFLPSITEDYYGDGKQTKQSNLLNDDSNAGQAGAREIDASANKIFGYKELEYSSNECFIGRGGFADVYKAVLRGNTTVAFKKPNIGGSRFTDTEMKDLIRESDILLAIPSHEHIVEIIGICIDSRHFGIVLEYVDGGDLSMLLPSHTSDPYMDEWKNKLDVASQIADGFKHLHGLHPPIIHRDLKPSNILVKKSSAKYTCKITDFGLAKIRATTTSTGNKSDGNDSYLHAAGSVAYIAPERYESRHLNMSALAKSDVYSFGVILFQFRERIRPFGDEENVVVIALNVKGGLPFSTPVKRCPCGYDELMRSCCLLNGGDRPAFTDILPTLRAMSHDTVS